MEVILFPTKCFIYLPRATRSFTVSIYLIIYLAATTSGQYKIHLVIMCSLHLCILHCWPDCNNC